MRRNNKLAIVTVLAIAAFAMFAGHPVFASPETMVGLGALPMLMGNVDFAEVKRLLDEQGRAWEEFKGTNDARLKAIEEKGYAPADLIGKVELINTDLTKLGKDLEEVMKKANRPGAGQEQMSADQVEHKQAFGRFLRKGDDQGLSAIQRKAMNSQSDPDGGYLILPEMDKEIDRVAPTISAMARLATVRTIGTAKYQKPVKTSGLSMTRVADGATAGESDNPNYSLIEIEAHSAEVEPWVFNETLEDAFINLESDLAEEAAIGFAEGAAAEFISGNGVGKARGITAYTNVANSSYAWGKVGYIASGASGAFTTAAPADKIVLLQHALKQQYRPGAVFLMSDATLSTVRTIKDGSGSYYLWQPNPASGFGGLFLGSPVEIDDNMPAIAANSYSIAYGNFKRGYAIVNRAGTVLIRDNITAKGKTKFNFRRRFGGGILNFEAIKLMKFAAS